MLTTEDPLLLQHRLTRVELIDTVGGRELVGERQELDPKQSQGGRYLLGGKDDFVSSTFSHCLVCIGHIWNKKRPSAILETGTAELKGKIHLDDESHKTFQSVPTRCKGQQDSVFVSCSFQNCSD